MEVLIDPEASREIYLIFVDSKSYPHYRFIKEGFRHVFAIERQPLGWICHDPNTQEWMSFIIPGDWENNVMGCYKDQNPNSTILKLEVKPKNINMLIRPHLVPCIGAMQYLLGVYWPLILTPYRLYSKLLNNPPINFKVEIYVGKRCTQASKPSSGRI